jgi:hypothetical protein
MLAADMAGLAISVMPRSALLSGREVVAAATAPVAGDARRAFPEATRHVDARPVLGGGGARPARCVAAGYVDADPPAVGGFDDLEIAYRQNTSSCWQSSTGVRRSRMDAGHVASSGASVSCLALYRNGGAAQYSAVVHETLPLPSSRIAPYHT